MRAPPHNNQKNISRHCLTFPGSSKGNSSWEPLLFHKLEKAMAPHSSTLLPEKSHGWRSLEGCSSWGRKELDTTERLNWTELKITADDDCSHEIKRHLLHGRKAMTNLQSILKSRDITLPTKVCIVKAMVFPIVIYGCESWTIKKVECQRIDAFELWCWRILLRVPWTARRSNQSILKEISPEYSL